MFKLKLIEPPEPRSLYIIVIYTICGKQFLLNYCVQCVAFLYHHSNTLSLCTCVTELFIKTPFIVKAVEAFPIYTHLVKGD